MLISTIIAYFAELFKRVDKPGTYGSELEQYIVSKNPGSVAEIEFWTTQYDRNTTKRGWPL
jgi:hypothetical protein